MATTRAGTLVLTRAEVASLLTLEECIAAVEGAFRLQGEGKTQAPEVLGVQARDGGFHVKAGILPLGARYFAAKVNANFPRNGERFHLPTIQGVIVLSDADDGYPLAVMDSIEITLKRTAAATAIAAKYLARSDATVAMVCGCGSQARIQLQALAAVRSLDSAYAYDLDEQRARRFAQDVGEKLGIEVVAVADLAEGLRASDMCVTCTTSTRYFLERKAVPAGMFVAAVGADNPEKQELDPRLLAASKVVVDVLEQCATIGDLHHALQAGVMSTTDVHAELGELVAGKKPGRTSAEEITIFDSTGMALQDVAAAAAVYEKANRLGRGLKVSLVD